MPRWPSGRPARGAAVALLIAALIWPLAAVGQGTVEEIASELICLCGCNKLLNQCDMENAREMKAVIAQKLGEGLGKAAIIAYLTTTYGERVLAAPPKRGFNLAAWLTPFGVVALGSVVIWLAVAAWVRRRRGSRAEDMAVVASGELEARYGGVLERELSEFEE